MTFKQGILAALLAAGGVTGYATYSAKQHPDLASALAAKGYVWAAVVNTNNGPVNFNATIDYPYADKYRQQHWDRYKIWPNCYQTPPGEPCSTGGCGVEALYGNWWLVEEVTHHPSNPLNIANNQAYSFTPQDQMDVERLTLRGAGCAAGALYGYFIPTAQALGITGEPPPTPTPTPKPPAPTPTTPPPVVTDSWEVEQVDCASAITSGERLCLEITYYPSGNSTGRLEVNVE